MIWKPIVGKAFPTAEDFSSYVQTLQPALWRPSFLVVHNTSAPDLKTYAGHWNRANPITDEQWMQNLVGYYRDTQHWSAGPHLFVTPKNICVFTPLDTSGVHSPSWNNISWGVECVGEFETDQFDGPVKDNLIAALAILHSAAGLQPLPYIWGHKGLHFHKEDPRTTHRSCPGRNMIKTNLVAAVQAYMDNSNAGEHTPGATGGCT